ncbi:MAG: hypothetical protein R6U32_01005 [Candidatus Woesearchaeota archaeon]
MKIAVYGSASGEIPEELSKKARELGKEIAIRGHTLITGGCPGLPYEAVLGAKETGGKTIAYSPGIDINEHKEKHGFPAEGFDEFVFVPAEFEFADDPLAARKYRNVTSTAGCDAGIIIKGAIGTLNEFTCLYDYGKKVGVFTGTGGATDLVKDIVETFKKPTKSRIVYESEPARLVERLEKLQE